MKISRIMKVAREDCRIRIVTDEDGVQWVCTNRGIYNLLGFPKIGNFTELLNFIGVSPENQEKWSGLNCCEWADSEIHDALTNRNGEIYDYIPMIVKTMGMEYAIIGYKHFLPLERLKPIEEFDKIEITENECFARVYNGVGLVAILLLAKPSDTSLANMARLGRQCSLILGVDENE